MDTTVVSYDELLQKFGRSYPENNAQINSTYTNRSSMQTLYCSGDAYVYGLFKTPLRSEKGIQFADGTSSMPIITFESDTNTGFYRAGDGRVGMTSDGTVAMVMGGGAIQVHQPITTNSGDLTINPAGNNVDFSGKNLINVGNIASNTNRYEVITPAIVTTNDNVDTLLYNISMTNNSTYLINTDVTCTSTTDMSSSAVFKILCKAKNLGGVVSVNAILESNYAIDNPLNGIVVNHSASGTNVAVNVTGLAATTIKWFGASVITRQLF